MNYEIKLIIDGYGYVEDEYKRCKVNKNFVCDSWDDVKNLLGLMIEASDETLSFEIKKRGLDNE